MSSFTDSPSSIDRAKLYKNNSKTDDSRRRRTECSIELRRQKRNDEMMKRRNLSVDVGESDLDTSITSDPLESDTGNKSVEPITVEKAVAILTNNPSVESLRIAMEGLRRMLSRTKDPPVDEVIRAGLVQALVQALHVDDEKVQFEASWALTNIVSGSSDQTMAVIQAGATKPLILLCSSSSPKLAEQAIWAVANIAGDSTQLRDHIVQEEVVPTLLNLMKNLDSVSSSFVRTVAWTYSNLVRHKNPQLPFEVLEKLAPGIAKLLKYKDVPVQQDSCWALSYFTDGADQNIELAYRNGVIPDVVSFISSKQDGMISPALRVLGNFATGNDDLTQVVVDSGILESVIPSLLVRSNGAIVKECCWLVSNVLAGTKNQIQAVIDADLVPLLFDVLKTGDHRSQFEASWAIANITHSGTNDQILQVSKVKGGLEAICHCLSVKNNELVSNMLESLYGILKTVGNSDPEKLDKVEMEIEECGGLDTLESLQHHDSQQIYDLAYKIVEEFFNDNEDGENVEPYDEPLDMAASAPFNF